MAVFPDPAEVLAGVVYGPNGTDYTGTFGVGVVNSPTSGNSPFAAVMASVGQRLVTKLGLDTAFVLQVANDRYKITVTESFFVYFMAYGIRQPRDPNLDYTDAGAGNLARSVARVIRVYVYTRQFVDATGEDQVALNGPDAAATVVDPPDAPGHFLAEELVFNALSGHVPLTNAGAPLTLGPLHPTDASEYPLRKDEGDAGLLRSCLDFEAVYLLAIDPTTPNQG